MIAVFDSMGLEYIELCVFDFGSALRSFNIPRLGKVCPVGHDDSAEHHIVLGEVAGEQLCGSNHWQAKHIWDLISMCCICPRWYLMSSRWIRSHQYYYIHVTDTGHEMALFLLPPHNGQSVDTHKHKQIKDTGKMHYSLRWGNQILLLILFCPQYVGHYSVYYRERQDEK